LQACLNGKIKMIEKNKVLLIYPPNQLMDIETPRPDGSLGLLYLASALEAKGIPTDVLDASVGTSSQSLQDTFYHLVRQENGLIRIGMDFEDIANHVIREKYNVVGISSNLTPQTRMVFETARAIKKADPSIKIYAGGINARALKERFLAAGYFDGVCLSEGELIFPRLVLEGVKEIPGMAFNRKGEIIVNPVDQSCFPKTLDNLLMPAWEKLPFAKYEQIASPHGVDVTERKDPRYAPIMTSRGCKFRCDYCHISTERGNSLTGPIGRIRFHSLERVLSEVEKLKSLGVGRLFFEDDSLFALRRRAKEILELIKNDGISITNVNGVNLIDYFAKTPSGYVIDKEFLDILRDAEFNQIVFPVESGSQRILNKYATCKVNLDKLDLLGLMKEMSGLGIKAPVNMMVGFPDETEEEVEQSIVMARRLMDAGAPYVTFFIPIPFPGSKLFETAVSQGYLDRDFDTDIMNWKRPVMQNTTIPPERLVEIRDRANEEVNTREHNARRLEQSAGHRWSRG